MTFSSAFGDDAAANQRRWRRDERNPVISPGAPWCPEFIAPCSIVREGEALSLFVEGGERDREAIGAYAWDSGNGGRWVADPVNPVLAPSADGFDRGSVFDPAPIRFAGALRLYYSATVAGAHEFAELGQGSESTPDEPECIGVATRTDSGFERRETPVLVGRCPNVFEWEGVLHMFYVDVVRGGYRIFHATSADGLTFAPSRRGPVLDVGAAGEWDAFTVTTPKVFRDDDHFTMLYAGDFEQIDDPTGIGIATSDDLVNWTKHPGNPVFVPGQRGAFDCASVASAVPLWCDDGWRILYAGSDRTIVDGLHSQVGCAHLVG